MRIMAGRKQESSGAHTHPYSFGIDESRKVSEELDPLVKKLNSIIDRLEHLASDEEGERGDDTTRQP